MRWWKKLWLKSKENWCKPLNRETIETEQTPCTSIHHCTCSESRDSDPGMMGFSRGDGGMMGF